MGVQTAGENPARAALPYYCLFCLLAKMQAGGGGYAKNSLIFFRITQNLASTRGEKVIL